MKSHQPDGSVLQDLNSMSDSVITEAPSLTGIANVRREDSMIDIDKVWERKIVTEFRNSPVCPA